MTAEMLEMDEQLPQRRQAFEDCSSIKAAAPGTVWAIDSFRRQQMRIRLVARVAGGR